MRKHRLVRRILSIVLAAAMVMPAASVAVEAATMTWLSPLPGESIVQRQVEVSVGYNTQSDLRVTRLQLWIDGKYYAGKTLVRPESRGVASFMWDTSKFSRGLHELVVKIFAGDELITSISGSSTIGDTSFDLRAPVVRFANIKSGDTLKGTSIIRMKVTDDGGESPMVSLLVDSVLKYLTNREPYAYPLDTTKYTDGNHELQTFAYDQAGNKSDPAVVKVSFQNGLQKPVVSALSVDPRPEPPAASEDDGAGVVVPPTASEPSRKINSAARAPEPSVRAETSGTVARPVGKPAEPKALAAPKQAIKTTTVKAPAVSAQPAGASVRPVERPLPVQIVASAPPAAPEATQWTVQLAPPVESELPSAQSGAVASGIRMAKATQDGVKSRLGFAEPSSALPAAESVARTIPTPALPSGKQANPIASLTTRQAIPPASDGDSIESAPRSVETSANPAPRPAQKIVIARSVEQVRSPETQWHDPMGSTPSAVSASAVSGIRSSASPARAVEAQPSAPKSMTSATPSVPKPVRTAMLPAIRGANNPASGHNSVAVPPAPRKDIRAKLEKRTVATKGKIKLRDLIDDMGGILFWDGQTHTVTAYTRDFKMEIAIGSPIVLVNGKEIRAAVQPRIVAGRTIIDASLYAQAQAAAEAGKKSAVVDSH